jgi:putative ABC transport system ATP-binding protein
MGIFQKLNLERGITIMLVTHEHDIAEYATRVITFRDGLVRSDTAVTHQRSAAADAARVREEAELAVQSA